METPSHTNSFNPNQEPPIIVEESKKRKPPPRELGFPVVKYRSRDRASSSCGDSESSSEPNKEGRIHGKSCSGKDEHRQENLGDSGGGSNSVVGGYGSTMTLDVSSETELYYGCSPRPDQPSTSSGSYNNKACRIHPCSPDSRSVNNTDAGMNDKVEDAIEIEPEGKDRTDQPHESGAHHDHSASDIDESKEPSLEEMSLLQPSNSDSDAFVLSSGRWTNGKDARWDADEQTIDKEFEQYFSKLML